MPFLTTDFPGLLIFEPKLFGDERGYFFESYNANTFSEAGVDIRFVQDNQARSVYGVVRGLHFQKAPHSQTKLVRVLEGEILDVVVDLRKGSPCYGKHFAVVLSAENRKQILVPKGFAHGYAVLSDTAEVFYKCDDFYFKEEEGGISFNDPALQIDWMIPAEKMILSAKDMLYKGLSESEHNFLF